jgi:hypothetical protein
MKTDSQKRRRKSFLKYIKYAMLDIGFTLLIYLDPCASSRFLCISDLKEEIQYLGLLLSFFYGFFGFFNAFFVGGCLLEAVFYSVEPLRGLLKNMK